MQGNLKSQLVDTVLASSRGLQEKSRELIAVEDESRMYNELDVSEC
jgi:hypothetical protein